MSFWKPRRTPGAWHARLALQLAAFDEEWRDQYRGRSPGQVLDLTEREIDVSLAHLNDCVEYDPRKR